MNRPETFENSMKIINHDQVILLLQLRVLSKEFVYPRSSLRACSDRGFWCVDVLEVVVVELSEERDEEGDNVREEAFWVVVVAEK